MECPATVLGPILLHGQQRGTSQSLPAHLQKLQNKTTCQVSCTFSIFNEALLRVLAICPKRTKRVPPKHLCLLKGTMLQQQADTGRVAREVRHVVEGQVRSWAQRFWVSVSQTFFTLRLALMCGEGMGKMARQQGCQKWTKVAEGVQQFLHGCTLQTTSKQGLLFETLSFEWSGP